MERADTMTFGEWADLVTHGETRVNAVLAHLNHMDGADIDPFVTEVGQDFVASPHPKGAMTGFNFNADGPSGPGYYRNDASLDTNSKLVKDSSSKRINADASPKFHKVNIEAGMGIPEPPKPLKKGIWEVLCDGQYDVKVWNAASAQPPPPLEK